MSEQVERCYGCKFSKGKRIVDEDYLFCRLNPPFAGPSDLLSCQPAVGMDDWCSYYKRIEAPHGN